MTNGENEPGASTIRGRWVAYGAGVGMIVGAAFGTAGVGLVLGAALGLGAAFVTGND
jgi:hypothetical protein